jgi:hypothetical protein
MSLPIRAAAVLATAVTLPIAGPVSCGPSISNAELQVATDEADKHRLEIQRVETQNSALKQELKELTPLYGGPEHKENLKTIEALHADKAELEKVKAEVAAKVQKFHDAAKAHRDYLSSQQKP